MENFISDEATGEQRSNQPIKIESNLQSANENEHPTTSATTTSKKGQSSGGSFVRFGWSDEKDLQSQQQQSVSSTNLPHGSEFSSSARLQCRSCDQSFPSIESMESHIQKEHASSYRNYSCKICGKFFATTSGLKQHMHIHSSVKPFVCEVCNRSYTQFSNLCRHKRMHADCCRKVTCSTCGDSFKSISALNKHRRFCINKFLKVVRPPISANVVQNLSVHIPSQHLVSPRSCVSASLLGSATEHPNSHMGQLAQSTPTPSSNDDIYTRKEDTPGHLSSGESPLDLSNHSRHSGIMNESEMGLNDELGSDSETEEMMSSSDGIENGPHGNFEYDCEMELARDLHEEECNDEQNASGTTKTDAESELVDIETVDRETSLDRSNEPDNVEGASSTADGENTDRQTANSSDALKSNPTFVHLQHLLRFGQLGTNSSVDFDYVRMNTFDQLGYRNLVFNLLQQSQLGLASSNQAAIGGLAQGMSTTSPVSAAYFPGLLKPAPSHHDAHVGCAISDPLSPCASSKEKYVCKFCHKVFPRSANLTRHLRTHTGEQPYVCKYCNRAFSISSNLQRHVRNIHNKEKPYQCKVCDKAFGQQTNLERHMKKHEHKFPSSSFSSASTSPINSPSDNLGLPPTPNSVNRDDSSPDFPSSVALHSATSSLRNTNLNEISPNGSHHPSFAQFGSLAAASNFPSSLGPTHMFSTSQIAPGAGFPNPLTGVPAGYPPYMMPAQQRSVIRQLPVTANEQTIPTSIMPSSANIQQSSGPALNPSSLTAQQNQAALQLCLNSFMYRKAMAEAMKNQQPITAPQLARNPSSDNLDLIRTAMSENASGNSSLALFLQQQQNLRNNTQMLS
ncbi:uncharacterized protein LOC142339411 isoform X2 [Convolutriloba macropyga]|uniref:uncharacterized protein LOC142339411 isoform X2 n=1 Tax=Convolutriloba macropyga TaxID=536237 RepID=UPI003F52730E